MSYGATGYGTLVAKDFISHEDMKALNNLDEFEIGLFGGSYYASYDRNFHSDTVEDCLTQMTKYFKSGEIEMRGEDDALWRYVFDDNGWHEESGRIVYSGDKREPLKFTNQQRLEFLGALIECFENFLDDKGIVIENPEKEQSKDCASNIYGTDYFDLESEIEHILKNWEVL